MNDITSINSRIFAIILNLYYFFVSLENIYNQLANYLGKMQEIFRELLFEIKEDLSLDKFYNINYY
jgi:hypothetical protein